MPTAALSAAAITVVAQQQGMAPVGARSTAATDGPTPTVAASPTAVPPPAASTASAPAVGASGAQDQPASATRAQAPLGGKGAVAQAAISARRSALASEATVATAAIAPVALAAYQRAAAVIDQADTGCNLGWPLLAAIGRVESDHGTTGGSQLDDTGMATPAIYGPALTGRHHTQRVADTDGGRLDGDKRFDRAVGPMQILPSTWVLIAVDGDGDGRRDPQDINDAALASAVYLCSTGADLTSQDAQRAALLRYNHSSAYATEVLTLASSYQALDGAAGGVLPAVAVLPALAGSETRADAGVTAASHEHHHHGHHQHKKKRHHGKHDGIKHHGTKHGTHHAATSTPGPTAATTTPGPTSKPAPSPSTDPAPISAAATGAQLEQLCRPAIEKAYPDASPAVVDTAVTSCGQQLSGLTLDQATAGLDDLVADLPDTVTGLEPEGAPSPSTGASDGPSGAGSGSGSDTASDGSSPASDTASDTASDPASDPASGTASGMGSADGADGASQSATAAG